MTKQAIQGVFIPMVPSELTSLSTYLERARELKQNHLHVAHQLKLLFVHAAMELGATSKEAKRFLLCVMDEIEQEKGHLPGVEAALDIRALALDLFDRARASDNVDGYPSATATWTITDAPKVARAYHASAVCFDALRFLHELRADDTVKQQSAHLRSKKLAMQLHAVCRTREPCIPISWQPLPLGLFPTPPPAAAPPAAAPPPAGPPPHATTLSSAPPPPPSPSPYAPLLPVPPSKTPSSPALPPAASEAVQETMAAAVEGQMQPRANAKPAGGGTLEGATPQAAHGSVASACGACAQMPVPIAAAASAAQEGLPAGWERRYDNASGRHFYIDLIGKRTSWTPPSQAAGEAAGIAACGPLAGVLPAPWNVERSTQLALAGVDAMWERLHIKEKPAAAANPPPANSREAMRQERAACRAAAVQNVLSTRAQAEAAMSQLEQNTRQP